MPATILIDKQGIIRYTHFGESMSDIPATDEMLEIIDRMNIK
jgi:peroxiredoxin Q/BCP